uniref:ARF interacting protein 2 n=1 Tax=Terrapene triunguis TaxID=2587831 RepID=A0A674JWP9_9SAUR
MPCGCHGGDIRAPGPVGLTWGRRGACVPWGQWGHPGRGTCPGASCTASVCVCWGQGGHGGGGASLWAPSSGLHPPHPSPLATGDEATRGIAVEKFDIVKKWGINTYKCTKQLISERFGRGSRTVDLELETQIELLRDTKRKYECVLQLARALTHHFYSLVQTQHALGDAFSDLSQKSPELQVWARGEGRPAGAGATWHHYHGL